MAHTPGPWKVGRNGVDVMKASEPNLGMPIARIQTFVAPFEKTQRDNARLIAAAPDLLEALKLLADHEDRRGWSSAALDVANAAIAKATVGEP